MKKAMLVLTLTLTVLVILATTVGCSKKTTTTTTSKTTTTTTTSKTTTTTAAAVPPNSPHTDGRTSCLVCHKDGIAGAPKAPTSGAANHASFTDALCTGCHKTTTTSSVPKLPAANHAGLTACLMCHKDGLAGAPKLTTTHAAYSDTTPAAAALCLSCHK